MAPIYNRAMFTAGAAQAEITPDRDLGKAGGFLPVHVEGSIDPLMARALVLSDGVSSIAFVTVDLIAVRHELLTGPLLQRLAGRVPLTEDQLILAASHTHSGPDITSPLLRRLRGGPVDTEQAARDTAVQDYLARVADALAQVVETAYRQQEPVSLYVAAGMEPETPENSRYLLSDGTIAWQWSGYTREEIVGPTGPVDAQVGILGVQRRSGSWLAVLYNFALHALSRDELNRGLKYSADYPGYAARVIEGELGAVPLFTAGACGNCHTTGRYSRQYIGTKLGREVQRVLSRIGPCNELAPLRYRRTILEIPYREPSTAHLEEVHRINRRWGATAAQHERRFHLALQLLERLRAAGPAQVPVQVFTFGTELAIVALPCELFVEYGLELKAKSPFRYTFVVTLANDHVGYLPTRNAFRWGSYQTWIGSNFLVPEAGSLVVGEALHLLNELWPG
jgi:neutral ceramidase